MTQRGNSYFFRISRLEAFVDATTAVPLELLPTKEVAILYSGTPGPRSSRGFRRNGSSPGG